MVWKVTNISDTGTSIKFGADDMDKVSKLFSGIDVDDVDINSDWIFRWGKLDLANPANTFVYHIDTAAITGNRVLNLPLITGTDTLATLGLPQTFTELQDIRKDTENLFTLTRDTNTATSQWGIQFWAKNAASSFEEYASIKSRIIANTTDDEDAQLRFSIMKDGTFTETLRLHHEGIVQMGLNQRAGIADTGLTAERTFTFPDLDTQLVGLLGTQTISGVKTFSDQSIKLRNPANTFSYTLAHGAISADRNLTVPLITGDDTIATINHTLVNPYLNKGTGATLKRQGIWWGNDNVTGDGILNDSMSSIGTETDVNDSTEGRGVQFATTAAANANAGIKQTQENFQRDWRIYMILRIKLSSTSDVRGFFGFTSSSTDIAGETTLNNLSGVGLGFRTGDTNWFTYTNDGDATEDRADTGVAKSTSAVTLQVELDSTSFRSKIGGTTNTAVTSELPAAATLLMLMCQIETGAGAADKNVQIFPVYVQTGGEVMI